MGMIPNAGRFTRQVCLGLPPGLLLFSSLQFPAEPSEWSGAMIPCGLFAGEGLWPLPGALSPFTSQASSTLPANRWESCSVSCTPQWLPAKSDTRRAPSNIGLWDGEWLLPRLLIGSAPQSPSYTQQPAASQSLAPSHTAWLLLFFAFSSILYALCFAIDLFSHQLFLCMTHF